MHIIYTVATPFPFGQAYASRVRNLCHIFMALGHEVTVFTDYISDRRFMDGKCTARFCGIDIRALAPVSVSERSIWNQLCDKFTIDVRRKICLMEYLNKYKVDMAICSSASDRFIFTYRQLRKKEIPIILESCEWFGQERWPKGGKDYQYRRYMKCWDNYFTQVDGVIAISRLLKQHYSQYVQHVERVPAILSTEDIPYDFDLLNVRERIRLFFAGSISSGKDRLIDLIKALHSKRYLPIELDIYGPSYQDIMAQLGDSAVLLNEIRNTVHIFGMVPQSDILKKIKQYDFGILLRPDRRSSHAGFPTKLAEYFAAGMPVLANDTGDVGLYVKDGYNGFIVENTAPQVIECLLERIVSLSLEEKMKMRDNARKTAEEYFDYRIYQEKIQSLFDSVIKEL